MSKLRLGILGSTRGTDMQAIIEAIDHQWLAANIEVVISNKHDAYILERAIVHNIHAIHLSPEGMTREAYDQKLSETLQYYKVDVVVLIGYMRILSKPFVREWEDKIINVHPSLLPAFAGGMDQDVHQAVLDAGVKETGCTVHMVTEEVDAGPILVQKSCKVLPDDTKETLKTRVQLLEGLALVEAIASMYKEYIL